MDEVLPKTNGSDEAKDERAIGHVVLWLIKNWKAGSLFVLFLGGGTAFKAQHDNEMDELKKGQAALSEKIGNVREDVKELKGEIKTMIRLAERRR